MKNKKLILLVAVIVLIAIGTTFYLSKGDITLFKGKLDLKKIGIQKKDVQISSPDLVVKSLEFDPYTLEPTVVIRNGGTKMAEGNFTVTGSWTGDGTIYSSYTSAQSNLESGAEVTIQWPSAANPQSNAEKFLVDIYPLSNESNIYNNSMTKTRPRPDLKAVGLWYNSENNTPFITIMNTSHSVGVPALSNFQLHVVMSNAAGTLKDVVITKNLSILAPAGSQDDFSGSIVLDTEQTIPKNTARVWVKIDHGNSLKESNEDNNIIQFDQVCKWTKSPCSSESQSSPPPGFSGSSFGGDNLDDGNFN